MTEFGDAEAEELLRLGWRQGATFYIDGGMAELTEIAEGTLAVIVTQSCTVVNRDLVKDPNMEIATVSKDDKPFNGKSQDAKGKNMRRLLVPLRDADGATAGYYVDVNSRRFVPRELFLAFSPNGPMAANDVCDKIGRWMGSVYSRAALPNNLVNFLRDEGITDRLEAALKLKRDGAPLHEEVAVIYADWSSEEEVANYIISFQFVCEDVANTADRLQATVEADFGKKIPLVYQSERLTVRIAISTSDAVTIADLVNMRRVSEWDFLSGLESDLDLA